MAECFRSDLVFTLFEGYKLLKLSPTRRKLVVLFGKKCLVELHFLSLYAGFAITLYLFFYNVIFYSPIPREELKQMLNKILEKLFYDPWWIFVYFYSRLFLLAISFNKNILISGRLKIIGIPIIDIRKGSALEIGDNVTINSRNKGYHINMHSPVKLFADRAGAIIKIGANTRLHGTCIHAYNSVEIGHNCLIAANCQIFDGSGHDLSFADVSNRIYTTGDARPIEIGNSVWIGANCIILPGVKIGHGSVISANSVVVKDIPPMVVAGGNPAKVIKSYAS